MGKKKQRGRPRKQHSKKYVTRAVCLPPDMSKWVTRKSKSDGTSASAVVSEAISERMDRDSAN
jgi:hypothetical protein